MQLAGLLASLPWPLQRWKKKKKTKHAAASAYIGTPYYKLK